MSFKLELKIEREEIDRRLSGNEFQKVEDACRNEREPVWVLIFGVHK